MLSGLTYNVFLGRNLESLLVWLYEQSKPLDLYCFQEFPERKILDLKSHLEKAGYGFVFAPGFTWRGITYGELTAFRKSKLTLLKTETISLGGKGEPNLVFIREGLKLDVRLARVQIDKSALLTTFQYKGHQFSLVNTHLSSDIHNTRKLKQLQRIARAVSIEDRVVVLGDFNYAFGKGRLLKLMNDFGFESGLRKQKTFRFAPGIYWQNDYIFQRNCDVRDAHVVQVTHSDHYPVFFKLSFPA